MSINNFLSLTLALFFIRIVCFVLCIPNNFDNLLKPGGFSSFSPVIYLLLFALASITLIKFVKQIGKANTKTQKAFFFYFLFIYLSYLLFNRIILKGSLDYLFILNYSNSCFDDIFPNLILDCFFEAPYAIWNLIFIGIVYWICQKHHHIEYTFYFWVIPFTFLQYLFNDLITTLLISYCLIALLGMKYSKGRSSIPILVINSLIIVLSILYSYKVSKLDGIGLKLAIETLIIFYLPCVVITYICKKEPNTVSLTWILPLLNLFFLFLPLYRLKTGINLISFITLTNTFLFGSNIMIVLPLFILFKSIFQKSFKILDQIVFYLLSLSLVIFYILDSALFYYSQFRINYQTIVWTQTMNDITRTTLTTCLNYLTPISSIIVIITFIFASLTLFKGKAILENKSIKYNFLFILLISHFSIALLQLSSPIPETLKEPFFELIKSIPISDYFKKNLSMEEIEKGFRECNLPLKKIPEDSIANRTDKTNIIIITLESVHWRYVNMFGKEPKTWPKISSFKNRMEIFPFIYSSFPDSTSGDYATLTGLIPYDHLYLHKNPNIRQISLVNELNKQGYNTYLFSSESLIDGGLNNFVKYLPFDYIFSFYSKDSDANNSWEWGYKEEYTSKKIIDFLTNREKDKPYFLWYRTVYPHAPFSQLDPKEKLIFQEKDDYDQLTLISKYKNALYYLDKVLFEFINRITELDKNNNQKTLIVMIGDHGEKLAEKDNEYATGHGLNTTPLLQNVACIFIKPKEEGLKINKHFGSQIDIFPTIMDYLKINSSVKRYEQGESLYSTDLATRPIYLSSIQSYALIENGYFFEFRDKNSPNVRITKLTFSDEDLKPKYESVLNWNDHKEIYEKHQKVKKFFVIQKEFMDQLK